MEFQSQYFSYDCNKKSLLIIIQNSTESSTKKDFNLSTYPRLS